MTIGPTLGSDIFELIFESGPVFDLAENDTSSPATQLDVALHTASPGEAGTMDTNEATYTGYARVARARDSAPGGWTVSGVTASNNGGFAFGTSSSGPETLTHFSVGKPGGGATQIIVYGVLTPAIVVNSGVTPEFAHGMLAIDWEI